MAGAIKSVEGLVGANRSDWVYWTLIAGAGLRSYAVEEV